jgi:uroporphyrinogen decarboxylase
MEDFERYDWPDESEPIDYRPFEIAAQMLPEGMKIIGGVGYGVFEWLSTLMGLQGLSLAFFENPDLVQAMIKRITKLILTADRVLAGMEEVCVLRQGDDLGYKTSTMLSPDTLRENILPVYKQQVEIAHEHDKPFILHSCGNLEAIYDALIDDVGIDGKHSFEEVILPVTEFKKRYGNRVTPLGGLDVDKICRGSEDEIRAYTRRTIEVCYESDGFYALGTGNQLTSYMPVENYFWMVDEADSLAR